MAAPSVDNGYTRIADELLEALIRFSFTKRQYKIVLLVIRKTDGYGKEKDDLSSQQLAEFTRLADTHCRATVRELVVMKVLKVAPGKYGQVISLNKDYLQWENQNSPGRTETVRTNSVRKREPRQSFGKDQNSPQQYTTPINNAKKQAQEEDQNSPAPWSPPESVHHQAWGEFEAHRREIRRPLTDLARTKNANVLVGYAPDVQQVIVDTTIANGWKGLFPPKGETVKTGQMSFTQQREGNTTGNLIEIFGEQDHGQDFIPGEHAVPGSSLRRGNHETAGEGLLAPAGRTSR